MGFKDRINRILHPQNKTEFLVILGLIILILYLISIPVTSIMSSLNTGDSIVLEDNYTSNSDDFIINSIPGYVSANNTPYEEYVKNNSYIINYTNPDKPDAVYLIQEKDYLELCDYISVDGKVRVYTYLWESISLSNRTIDVYNIYHVSDDWKYY